MKRALKKVLRYTERLIMLKEFYISAGVLAGIYGYISGIFAIRVTLPVWILCLIGIGPLVFYLGSRMIYHRRRRKYKPGDKVNIIADNRKFIVIRYMFWFPSTVICKENGRNNILEVNQKYIQPYIPPKNPNPLESILGPDINSGVPTVKIRHL